MYCSKRFVPLLLLTYLSSLSSAYQCTFSNAKAMTQGDLNELVLGSTTSLDTEIALAEMQLNEFQAGLNLAMSGLEWAVEVTSRLRKRRNIGTGPRGRIRARAPGDTMTSMTCSSSEACLKISGEVGCWNSATYTMRDSWGASLNVFSGDYVLPDGTEGNILTSPGPFLRYDPQSDAYKDDDTDSNVSGGGLSGSTATADLAAAETRMTATASSDTGSGVGDGSSDDIPKAVTSDAMAMGTRQSIWGLAGIVGAMVIIGWI